MNEIVQILYASETGNCEEVSERLWRMIKANFQNLKCEICSMHEYDVRCLIDETFVIFVCSTTNDGDEPATMRSFWKFLLRKNLPSDSLAKLKFVILGLGDSNYLKFNYVAKRLNKRLLQLGAQQLLDVNYADDQHEYGYDSVAVDWIDQVVKIVCSFFMLPPIQFEKEFQIPIKSKWSFKKVQWNDSIKINDFIYANESKDQFFAKIISNQRVTADDHFQNVILIRFQSDYDLFYEPGDVLCVRPWNSKEHISEFLEILQQNQSISIDASYVFDNGSGPKIPPILRKPLSFYKLCEEFWDLNAVPRRHTFRVLASITNSELEKERLLEFCTPEGLEDLYDYCNRPRRTILEVLRDFPHSIPNLTVDLLFDLMPVIQPRSFSIASSRKAHSDRIVEILVAVVRYKTKLKKERAGLCSNWLASLQCGSKALVWITKGSFKFPDRTLNHPNVIMVGPGTGIAPFRSFILDQAYDQKIPNLMLFFGCRNKQKDYFFKDEFEKLSHNNTLCLFCAFSRDQNHKIYVQHRIRENAELVWQMMNSTHKLYIFIAGNAKNMPKEVREAFEDVASMYLGSSIKGKQFIANLEKLKRFQNETWS